MDGPFGTVLTAGETFDDLVRHLGDGAISEKKLCQASDRWAVVDLHRPGSRTSIGGRMPGPTRGPVPTSWSTTINRDCGRPAVTYVLRYGERDVWKIGWCGDLLTRLRDVNRHVPFEATEERWAEVLFDHRSSEEAAYAFEQALFGALKGYTTTGERVICSERTLMDAWASTHAQQQ